MNDEIRRESNLSPQDSSSPGAALVVKSPWAEMILQGRKCWELRSQKTQKRERICIALSGSKKLLGEVDLVDCIELDDHSIENNFNKHQVVDPRHILKIQSPAPIYAWVLQSPSLYSSPKEYHHPSGAITWVQLNKVLGSSSSPIMIF